MIDFSQAVEHKRSMGKSVRAISIGRSCGEVVPSSDNREACCSNDINEEEVQT
jgi:hypothetical protein